MSKDTEIKKRISKTRQAKMREKELKFILELGVKLVSTLAVVIGCAQLFFCGENMVAGGGNGPAVRVAAKNSEAGNNQSDSIRAGRQGNALEPFLPDPKKGQQQISETIASFAEPGDGLGNVAQAASSFGDTSLDPAGGRNKLFSVPGSADIFKPMIAFTFDGGPYYSVDIRILGTPQTCGGGATPFTVGSRASDYKDTLKRIQDSGSEIENRTFNHKNLEEASPEEVAFQIGVTNDAVEAVTGFWSELVRVPYGAFKSQVPGLISHPMIQWNIDTQGWSSEDKDAIAASVLSRAEDGGTTLMHDFYPATAEVFETVIPLLTTQGYQFVTISKMYAAKGVPSGAGQAYFSIPN